MLLQFISGEKDMGNELDIYVDSDWAGCTETRRSINGGCMVLDDACLKVRFATQAARALSSGGAEY